MSKSPRDKRRGAPSKYDVKDYPGTVDGIVAGMSHKNFFDWCAMDHIAQALHVHRDTVNEWRSKYPDFEDAMEHWELKRNTLFYLLIRVLDPAKWIFLAKNWLDLTDKQFLESKVKVTENIKFVSKFPILDSQKGKKK